MDKFWILTAFLASEEGEFNETLDLDNFEVIKQSPDHQNHQFSDTFNISKSQLHDTKIRIKAIEFEKKNLFTSRKIFVMVTEPHDWEVRRRLSDYRWLSERLRREFP